MVVAALKTSTFHLIAPPWSLCLTEALRVCVPSPSLIYAYKWPWDVMLSKEQGSREFFFSLRSQYLAPPLPLLSWAWIEQPKASRHLAARTRPESTLCREMETWAQMSSVEHHTDLFLHHHHPVHIMVYMLFVEVFAVRNFVACNQMQSNCVACNQRHETQWHGQF